MSERLRKTRKVQIQFSVSIVASPPEKMDKELTNYEMIVKSKVV